MKITTLLHAGHRRRLLVVGLLAGACLVTWAGPALAAGTPGAVTGLASSTHPDEATWYRSSSPAFSWAPTQANGAAVAGYSYVFDQNPATVPDTSSERVSLDFLTKAAYACGTGPSEVRVGDLDGDGRQDVVTANSSANTISVLLGRGDGTFNAKVDYATATQPWSMELGDLDRDGKLDVVTGDYGSNRASVRLGNGDGTFGARAEYTIGSQPECLRIGDLNHDDILDIVTTNAGANTISVLLGRGDGTFNAKVDYATSVHPTSIDLGDLNGDDNADLIAANTGPSTVSVLLGRGDGTFNAKVDYATGNTPYTVIVADVNGDNELDVETVNYGANSASILIGNGDGTLQAKVDYTVGACPYALDVRDLNQDGAPDLVTTNNSANTASVLMGNGDGTFNAKTDYATGNGPFWVTLGDFNGDGYGDLVTTDYSANTVSVRLGTAYLAVSFSGKADGIWYFHVRAVDSLGVGGSTATRSVRIDATAPTTSQTGADGAWHAADVTIDLSASDASSGVASTEYKVDGGGWTSGTSVVIAAPDNGSNDGMHTIQYRSTDVAGNVETAKTCTVGISRTAPTTSVSGADGAWHDSDVTLTFSASGNGTLRTEYQVDGGGWVDGTTVVIPAPANGSNDGVHAVTYRSTDAAGNVESEKSVDVKIDAGAPATTVSGADGAWHDSDVTLTFSGSDAGSGVATTEHRLDGGAWVEGTAAVVPAPGDGSKDGVHTVEYRSTDAAGHVETAKSVDVKIDTVGPTPADDNDDLWHGEDFTLELTPTDRGSSVAAVEYSFDGGTTWESGDSVFFRLWKRGGGSGQFEVTYRATDGVGHVGPADTTTVLMDGVRPRTSDDAPLDPQATDVTVTLSASDAHSGVKGTWYRVDGGDLQSGSSVLIPAPSDHSNDGLHTIQYFSVDQAGNIEQREHRAWVTIATP